MNDVSKFIDIPDREQAKAADASHRCFERYAS